MSGLFRHWSFDPFLVVVVCVAAINELGLHHLAGRSTPARTAARRRRAWFFYGGLAVLVVAVMSPIDYWADYYFFVHMIQHLLLMFAAPSLVVIGAPWVVLAHGLPVGVRRRVGRALLVARWSRPLRAVGRFLISPIFAILFFNAVMLFWHLPGPFDLAQRNHAVHVWLMHASFFVAGVLFWLQFITSHPFKPRLPAFQRVVALFMTNVVMFVLAMAMSLFATGPWYSVYNDLPGVTFSAMGDQQLGAAILWVCGDFWCFPTLVITLYEIIHADDGEESGIDVLLHHRTFTSALAASGRGKPPRPKVTR